MVSLYQYKANGELACTAVDLDRDDVIDFSGADRIHSAASDVIANYSTNVRRMRSYVWGTNNQNISIWFPRRRLPWTVCARGARSATARR